MINTINKTKAIETSEMKYEVYTPVGYDNSKTYPLFLVLHGDGGNIDVFSKEWTPDILLEEGFIVAYIQSSSPALTDCFEWTTDYVNSQKNITECYNILVDKYSIDLTKVYLGGFSGGCMASLNVLLNNTVPVQGVIALCPAEMYFCTEDSLKEAALRGAKIALFEGDKYGEVTHHLELVASAGIHNLPIMYSINKDAGHYVPENWNEQLKKGIKFITT